VRPTGRKRTIVVFATTGLVFIAAGAVLTDPALTFGTTRCMAGFWMAAHGGAPAHRMGGIAFFLGLAVGLLAKGPVAVVLTLFPDAPSDFFAMRNGDLAQLAPLDRSHLAPLADFGKFRLYREAPREANLEEVPREGSTR
jgi:hypothetical protein